MDSHMRKRILVSTKDKTLEKQLKKQQLIYIYNIHVLCLIHATIKRRV